MGTMRKMEDSPTEEKAIAAVRAVKSETRLLGSAKTSNHFQRSKRFAEKLRRRDGPVSNGSRSVRRRLDAHGGEESGEAEPSRNETADHHQGDVPMDLSKRSEEEPNQKSLAVTARNGEQRDDGDDAGDGAEVDDGGYQEMAEEPLNLSRHGNVLCQQQQQHNVAAGRWNSCPRLSNNQAASNSPNVNVVSGSTDLLQKRVRLEEMVSYIRRYSVVDAAGRHRGSATVDGIATMVASHRGDSGRFGDGELEDEEGDVEENEAGKPAYRVVSRAVKRSMSCSSLETSSTSASHRRKSATPYRGSTLPSKRAKSNHPSVREDIPKDLRMSGVPNGATTGGFVSYPVLRQQLLGVDCRQLGLLQSVASINLTKDEGRYDEESNEMAANEAKKKPDDDREVEEDDDDEGVDGGALLRHQMRFLSTSGTSPARLPWTAYAYYANLFQELQGSLTSQVSPTSVMSLPLSLSLPLAIPAQENRAESLLSEDDEDDVGGNAATLTSGTVTAVGNNVAASAGGTLIAAGDGSTNNTSAMFRKRAPRALTGKHVKHGTGASPATLLTLRQKIEQKRIQQQQMQHRLQPSNAAGRLERRATTTENHGIVHKSLKSNTAATILKKKKAVS